ncbi:MAG: hypothetical protein GY711_23890 [bacterium]|nr:hypothetical protein [bacterium]
MIPTTTTANDGSKRLRAGECLALVVALVVARLVVIGSVAAHPEGLVVLRYARNLADGAGLVFNPTVPWIESPLTAAIGQASLVAMLQGLGFGGLAAARTWNVAAEVVSVLIVCSLWRGHRLRCVAFVVVLAALPALAAPSLGATYAPLLTCALLWATWSARTGAIGLAGLLSGLAISLRPGALLFVPLFALFGPGGPLRTVKLVRFVLGLFVTGGAYVLLMHVGLLVPFAELPLLGSRRGAADWSALAGPWTWGLAAPAALGMVALVRERDASRALVLTGCTLFALDLGLGLAVGAPRVHVLVFAGALGLARGIDWCGARFGERLADARAVVPVGAVLAVAITLSIPGRDAAVVTDGVYRKMAEWAEESGFGDDDAQFLYASEVGAIGYFGGGIVFDEGGNLWREAMRDQEPLDAAAQLRPEYILLHAARPLVAELRAREELTRSYYPIRRFSAYGETVLEPALEELPDRRGEDYLLYRRRL